MSMTNMLRKKFYLRGTSIFLLVFVAVTTSFADGLDKIDAAKALRLVQQGEILPLKTILERNKSLLKGKVLDVEFEHAGKKLVYEIKLLKNNGERIEIYFDAKTGLFYKTEPED